MLRLQSKITIGDYEFDFANEVTINSSWKNLTDTATIKLPKSLKTEAGLGIEDVFKAGDKVKIQLGYYDSLKTLFLGYVTVVGAASNICEITCEDEMWQLKQSAPINKSWAAADLKTVIDFVKQKIGATWEFEALGDAVNIGQLALENLTAAKVLQTLKEEKMQTCFFRIKNDKPVLIIGKPYEPNTSKVNKANFVYGKNVISWKDLSFKKKNEVKLKVKVVNHLPDGTTKEFTIGDDSGEERTLSYYNEKEADLKKMAQADLERLKYDGFRGFITCFGEPVVEHGDIASFDYTPATERNGDYWIDAVEREFKESSSRQKITIGAKV